MQPLHGRNRRAQRRHADAGAARRRCFRCGTTRRRGTWRRWRRGRGGSFFADRRYAGTATDIVRDICGGLAAGRLEDGNRLTLNIGVALRLRSATLTARSSSSEPWLPGNLPHDKNNFAPRTGSTFKLDDKTSLRGGYGLFFAFAPNDGVQQATRIRAPVREPDRQQRPCRLRDRTGSDQALVAEGKGRAKAEFASVARERVRHLNRTTRLHPRADAGDQLSRPPDAVQPSGVGRRSAPDRRASVGRDQLRPTRVAAAKRPRPRMRI